MSDNWVMVVGGVFLIIFGYAATHVTGPMPGSTLRAPMPLRMRVILIGFGVLMIGLGAARIVSG